MQSFLRLYPGGRVGLLVLGGLALLLEVLDEALGRVLASVEDEVVGEVADTNVLDAALIAAAQAVEHYEMTRYGTLVAWAKQMGRADSAGVLQQTLDEERATDSKLTKLAEGQINRKAA